MTASFTCSAQPLGDSQLVTVTGELDLHTFRELETRLGESLQVTPGCVLDLSDVTFMDSTALGVLVAAHRHSITPLKVVTSDPRVLKVFRLTGLQDVFTMFCTREEALAAGGHAVRRERRAASMKTADESE